MSCKCFSFGSSRLRGVSLLEGVLYLVVALAIIVGGIVFFSEAQMSTRVLGTSRAGISISSEVRGLFLQQKSFGSGDLSTTVVSSGAISDTFKSEAGDVIEHPFNGLLRVQGNLEGFAIIFEDLPVAACIRLATVGENGAGVMGTGVAGVVFSSDASAISWDGDLSDEVGWQPAPIGLTEVDALCTEDGDVVISYNRS